MDFTKLSMFCKMEKTKSGSVVFVFGKSPQNIL